MSLFPEHSGLWQRRHCRMLRLRTAPSTTRRRFVGRCGPAAGPGPPLRIKVCYSHSSWKKDTHRIGRSWFNSDGSSDATWAVSNSRPMRPAMSVFCAIEICEPDAVDSPAERPAIAPLVWSWQEHMKGVGATPELMTPSEGCTAVHLEVRNVIGICCSTRTHLLHSFYDSSSGYNYSRGCEIICHGHFSWHCTIQKMRFY